MLPPCALCEDGDKQVYPETELNIKAGGPVGDYWDLAQKVMHLLSSYMRLPISRQRHPVQTSSSQLGSSGDPPLFPFLGSKL